MELHQLRCFQKVAQLEHMSIAAEQLHIAQPSLSKSISRLEKALGGPLFDRKGRHIKLNSAGKAYLQRVERIFQELEDGEREVKTLAGAEENLITCSVTSLQSFDSELLSAFSTRYPKHKFRLSLASSLEMVHQLKKGEVELCFSSPPLDQPDIVCAELKFEEVYLAISTGHRLAGRQSIRLPDIAEEAFIALKKGHAMRDFSDALCRQAGFEPNIAFEVNEPSAAKYLVKSGLGITFTPESTLQDIDGTLRLLHFDKPIHRRVCVSWSNKRYMSTPAAVFRDFVIRYYSKPKT